MLGACAAQIRRGPPGATQGADPGLAGEAVRRIRRLYRIEHYCKAMPPEQRYRQRLSRPRLEAFHRWLQVHAPQVAPKSLLGKAIG